MKKIIVLAAFFVFIFSRSFAQDTNFEYGFGAGLNLSDINNGYTTNTKIKVGYNAQAFGEYFFSEKWGVKVKAMYDQKGWADATVGGGNYKLSYATVPLLAEIHFLKSETKTLYVGFGPYVGFLLGANELTTNTAVKSYFNNVDGGLEACLGAQFYLSDNSKFFFETDNALGITDIFKNNPSSNPTLNQRYAITVGMVFSVQ